MRVGQVLSEIIGRAPSRSFL